MFMSGCVAKTAGIIIIGNEILSGKILDSNSIYLASELRTLGVNVMRISVIPDEIETIGEEVSLFSGKYDYVFTAGGVGPTHDDVTMAGIAKGFGVALKRDPELEKSFRTKYGTACNAAIMKMAEVPEGAEIITVSSSRFPVVSFRNVFIFPGIPQYLRDKFSAIRERFRSPAYFLKKLYLDAEESEIAAALSKSVSRNDDISFGSYPVLDNSSYKILITAESKNKEALEKAVEELLHDLPEHVGVRLE